jgi:hypothetical protein
MKEQVEKKGKTTNEGCLVKIVEGAEEVLAFMLVGTMCLVAPGRLRKIGKTVNKITSLFGPHPGMTD